MTNDKREVEFKTLFTDTTKRYKPTAKDDDGNVVGITGATITYVLADDRNGTIRITKDNDGEGGVAITDAANGKFEITLDPADTQDLTSGEYYAECEIDDDTNEAVGFFGWVTVQASTVPD